MELQLRLAGRSGFAPVRLRITGPIAADGCVEVTCVETITDGKAQQIVLSDEES